MSRAANDDSRPHSSSQSAKFVEGSILRHILVMSAAGGVGLMALFVGDLATIYFLSLLNEVEPVAAVGYASSILFLSTSVGIGLSIAATAVVSRAIGARRTEESRRLAGSSLLLTASISVALNIALWIWARECLSGLGATGRTLELGVTYLRILVPFQTALMIGMTTSGLLRSVGDARGAMNTTLLGAVINIALDAVLILWLGLGVEGAAWASAASRTGLMALGLYLVLVKHDQVRWPGVTALWRDMPEMLAIAVPAVLTNIATPAASAFVTWAMAPFGDEGVAAWAIIGRLIPVAFGALFALSGSVGPIVGQNYGAGKLERVEETLTKALWVTAAISAIAWGVLWLASDAIIAGFRVKGETAALVRLFSVWLAPLFVFLGMLFVANAFFNTLKKPHLATALNWGRATLGTIPFVTAGGWIAGSKGVLVGQFLGQIVFGVLAVWLCYRLVRSLEPMARIEPEVVPLVDDTEPQGKAVGAT